MPKPKDGCVVTAKGPITSPSETTADTPTPSAESKETAMSVLVGKPAPDFEAAAYINGGFENIRLSSYRGQWVVLCFYPGDFTFV